MTGPVTGRELYEGNANRVKPAWSQLGQTTQDVWNEYAAAGMQLEDCPIEPTCLTNPSQ